MKTCDIFAILFFFASSAFSQSSDDRLIQLSANSAPQWHTPGQLGYLLRSGKNFVDVTDRQVIIMPRSTISEVQINYQFPNSTRFTEVVNDISRKLSKENARAFVTKMTSWNNRFYNTTGGIEASNWIQKETSKYTRRYGKKGSTLQFKHKFPQSSIIARIEGYRYPDEIVILGGHFDSINFDDVIDGRAPGADDNASGSSAIMEILRVLTESRFRPKRTIEFHWYAGEEMGLLGSSDIAQAYKSTGKKVVSMMQLDMIGHIEEGIQINKDYTDPEFNEFLKVLIEAYTDTKWLDSSCGYACSDHYSWNEMGYKSAFPFEDNYNEDIIHNERDTIDTIDFDTWNIFAQIATAYLIEIAEPLNY